MMDLHEVPGQYSPIGQRGRHIFVRVLIAYLLYSYKSRIYLRMKFMDVGRRPNPYALKI